MARTTAFTLRSSRPLRPPAGTGTLAHLERERKAAGVDYVLAVQTTTYYGWDNRFLVDCVRANPTWMAGICTLNPDDPHSPELLAQYSRGHNIRGVRIYQAADGRLDHPAVVRLWEVVQKQSMTPSVRINRDKSAELGALLGRFPAMNVVVDHSLYLAAGPDYDAILNDLVALAKHPNLFAKLSFVPTGSAQKYPFADMHDACRRIIQAYGPDRCLWGSAFPCELWCPKTTYAQHLAIFARELNLDDRAKEAILGGTAHRLYWERRA